MATEQREKCMKIISVWKYKTHIRISLTGIASHNRGASRQPIGAHFWLFLSLDSLQFVELSLAFGGQNSEMEALRLGS